jgi:hypothetical protein
VVSLLTTNLMRGFLTGFVLQGTLWQSLRSAKQLAYRSVGLAPSKQKKGLVIPTLIVYYIELII